MNEIVTFAGGYDLQPGIEVFLSSSANIGNVIFIQKDCTPRLSEKIELYPHVKIIDAKTIVGMYNVDLKLSPYTLKVIFFYLYTKHMSKADNLYLCDLTDVYFQDDPFNLIKNDNCYVTSECKKVGECETNTTWMRLCYNDDMLRVMGDKPIINGGSILGKREACTNLLKEMCTDMEGIIGRLGNYPNIDQACLTKTVHIDNKYNILSHFEIANMAHHHKADIELCGYNFAVNGYFPCVIHQYDGVKVMEDYIYANR